MEYLPIDLNWSRVLHNLLHLGVALILTLPIGWNRERAAYRTLGLRTFPLVAVASCGYVLVAQSILTDTTALSRILQGLITGIGFLGGAAILKDGNRVHGTATAASIWATAGLGAAVAFGLYEVALALAVILFLVLQGLTSIKEQVNGGEEGEGEEDAR